MHARRHTQPLPAAPTCLAVRSHESWRTNAVSVGIMAHPAVQALWTVLVTARAPLLTGTTYRQKEFFLVQDWVQFVETAPHNGTVRTLQT